MQNGTSFVIAATAIPGVAVKDTKDNRTEQLPEMNNGDVCSMVTPGREIKRQNGPRFKAPNEATFTVTSADKNGVAEMENGKLRIRYLTPRECLRLMDQPDNAIDRLMEVEPSKTVQYRLAGNSIVVSVLEAIFKGIYINNTFEKPKKYVSLEDYL